MPDRDNKLGKAKDLGQLSGSRLHRDSLSSTDLDDLCRFQVSDRSNLEVTLSGIARGADLDIELYAITSAANQFPRKLANMDFRKLRKVDLNSILQLKGGSKRKGHQSERASIANLNAGHYIVRVKHRKGSSRYQLNLSANPITENPGTIDTVAPTATFNINSPVKEGEHLYFTVTYNDNIAIDSASIEGGDIVVTGANGFRQSAVAVSLNSNADGSQRTVKYKITKSAGTWNNSDHGTYDIFLQSNEVKDTSGNYAVEGRLGSLVLSGESQDQPGEQTQSSDLCYVSGRPHGGYTRVAIDFSRTIGAGGGAIASGIEERPSGLELERPAITFQSGDLIFIGINNGQIKYQAKLLSGDGWYLYVQFLIRADVSATITNPTSLSALKAAMAIPGAVAMGAERTQEDRTLPLSQDPRLSYGFSSNYLMTAGEQSYTLSENPSSTGNITVDYDVFPDGNNNRPKEFGVIGSQLANTIVGNSSDNFLQGLGGDDLIQGEGGSDTLKGGAGNDTLKGGAGTDYLYGGAGNNILEGGADDDDYMLDSDRDVVIEQPNSGDDTVYASVSGITLAAHVETLILSADANSTAIEGFGNNLDNTVRGNYAANRLHGYAGNDQIIGSGGDDQLFGGEGDDSLDGDRSNSSSTLNRFGNDTLFGGGGNDSLTGEDGNDQLYGEDGNDSLEGGIGDDLLSGGNGTNRLNGTDRFSSAYNSALVEFDVLVGGSGIDYFILGGSWGASYVETGDGYATIQNWNSVQDWIETSGSASQYSLEFKNVIGSAAFDTEVYYSVGGIRDRIAIVQDTTNVSISRDFRFV